MSDKTIIISGKNNNDKINLINTNEKAIRKGMDEINISHREQVGYMNFIYMNSDTNNSDNNSNNNSNNIIQSIKTMIMREIEKKIQGYKQQDIKKQIFDATKIINIENVIEKLVISKLRCFYCRKEIMVLYKNVREPVQWTLDRKENDDCHSNENTIISCLKCNLQRRVINVDKFTFTKHLRIKKEV
jgi:hypothetical protein